MGQEFNLLGAAPRASRQRPAAKQVALAVGVTLVVAVTASAWLGARADAAEERIAAASLAVEDLILNLQERSQFLAQRNADPALVERLQRLERESTDKGKVLDVLAGRALGNAAGFSAHLAALGRRYPDGLWLRQVTIAEGGQQVELRGRALDAALVPRFIAALRDEPAFQGTAFQRFELENAPGGGGPVSFALATHCSEDVADCAEPDAAMGPDTNPEAAP